MDEKFQAKNNLVAIARRGSPVSESRKRGITGAIQGINDECHYSGKRSPPVLQEWSLDGTRLSGTLDKRTVWLQYQSMGRLDGDPAGDTGNDANTSILTSPGGFVEAVGGRVYELGSPRRRKEQATSSETTI